MADLEMKRNFAAPPERVFAFVTQSEHLTKWWGPEEISLGENQLDFSKTGPWMSVMHGSEGTIHKVSGEILSVGPGDTVTFTWAWHDDKDQRGDESRVCFAVDSDGQGGSIFTMLHSGLPSDDSASDHKGGWGSSFDKLGRYAERVAARKI